MTVPETSLRYPLHQATLDNGLRVIVNPDHSAPVVAVNLWYDVGSRDETPGRTGLAHLFEHLMFQGSAGVASGEHLALMQSVGGSVNATTWFDRTNYFETVPTGALDLALWLEADRLATLRESLTQANLDNQRDVVKEEKRQRYDNVPYGDVVDHLSRLGFGADPGQRPRVGEPEGVAADQPHRRGAAALGDELVAHQSPVQPGGLAVPEDRQRDVRRVKAAAPAGRQSPDQVGGVGRDRGGDVHAWRVGQRREFGERARDGLAGRADLFGTYATLQGDPNLVNTRVAEYCSIGADEVARAAAEWLRGDQAAVLSYRRASKEEPA